MSDYLARLRALSQEKRLSQELPQLPKAPSDSFGSLLGRYVSPDGATSDSFGSSLGRRVFQSPTEERNLPKVVFNNASLQRDADRRNLTALREGRTDRYCACGRLARLAWPDGNLRERWRCDDCAPTAGRA